MLRRTLTCWILALSLTTGASSMQNPVSIGTFAADVTPPIGTPLCDALVLPARKIVTPLQAKGLVVLGAGDPIVLCALDWVGVGNGGHDAWRDALAKAAGTTRNRVCVHALHPHDAPGCDFDTEALLAEHGLSGAQFDPEFARSAIRTTADAVSRAVESARPATHFGYAQAEVEKVASNRRILGPDGTVEHVRFSKSGDPKVRAKPEGVIDRMLRGVSFWAGDEPLAHVTYYATHPQSYYGSGSVNPDFVGLARDSQLTARRGIPSIHFNGAGGNVAAGKYNDGSTGRRLVLTQRLAKGMNRAWEDVKRRPLAAADVEWRTTSVTFDPAPHLDESQLLAALKDADQSRKERVAAARNLIWLRHAKAGRRIDLACLRIGDVHILHLPGELFVEYQLEAQRLLPEGHVCVAAYGDYGMGYIGTEIAYGQGGYETGPASRVASTAEQVLMPAIRELLGATEELVPLERELPRIAPLSPEAAREAFDIAPGYRVELVAAEPHVVDPVDMAFDEAGNLWVAEMRDYPFDKRDGYEPSGSIRLLRDRDQDGVYESSTVFADGLSWPTAVEPSRGGVFVIATPNVLWFQDTDGDDKADVRKVILSGLGRKNVQTLANNLVFDPSGWFVAAGGGNGGVLSMHLGSQPSIRLDRGVDFRFDWEGYLEPLPGGGQFGHTIDDFGRRFVCSNSNWAQYEFIGRMQTIAGDGGNGPVHRISPPEPWRTVRTRMRLRGDVGGPIEHGGSVSGYFTSATGLTVYRGSAMPEFGGDLFVGDVASNLVRHARLEPDGPSLRAQPVEQDREFLASTDRWFRPVNFANGPDGALYICDMYREVVEHPWSLPDEIKQHLDLMSGDDRGRIWRVVPAEGADSDADLPNAASPGDLAVGLTSPNGWTRSTAARLIHELPREQRPTERLIQLVFKVATPETSAIALRVLAGYDAESLRSVVRNAVRGPSELGALALRREFIAGRTGSLAPYLRLGQDVLAVALQEAARTGHPDFKEFLFQAARRESRSPKLRAPLIDAVIASAKNASPVVFGSLCNRREITLSRDFLIQLGERVPPAKAGAAVDELMALPIEQGLAVLVGLRRHSDPPNELFSEEWLRAALQLATSKTVPARVRADAIRALDIGTAATAALDASDSPKSVRRAAYEVLMRGAAGALRRQTMSGWTRLEPEDRSWILENLTAKGAALDFVELVEEGRILPRSVPPAVRDRLRRASDDDVQRVARRVFRAPASDRDAVVNRYRKALDPAADPKLGAKVFAMQCATCHRLGGEGGTVGPALDDLALKNPSELLIHILDPNRQVDSAWELYSLELVGGQELVGTLQRDGADAFVLCDVSGARTRIDRDRIVSFQSLGISAMPAGLESAISIDEMNALLAHLRSRPR